MGDSDNNVYSKPRNASATQQKWYMEGNTIRSGHNDKCLTTKEIWGWKDLLTAETRNASSNAQDWRIEGNTIVSVPRGRCLLNDYTAGNIVYALNCQPSWTNFQWVMEAL